jgi:hypothetical protein
MHPNLTQSPKQGSPLPFTLISRYNDRDYEKQITLLVYDDMDFGRKYRLHHQGRRVSQAKTSRSTRKAETVSAGVLLGLHFDSEYGEYILPKRLFFP